MSNGEASPKPDVKVQCTALYKTAQSVNIQLSPTQAIKLAGGLLEKALAIIEGRTGFPAVHIWNEGVGKEGLNCGFGKGRKGLRRAKKTAAD